MHLRGLFVPGLAMAADELPTMSAVLALDNPEVGRGPALGRPYTLEEVAEIHVRRLERERPEADPLVVCGMSMGGMIVAIMASLLRSRLPSRCAFHFLVTTANTPDNPAAADALVAGWGRIRPGVVDDFERGLSTLFSARFVHDCPAAVSAYYAYRASGGNRQTSRAFYRQLAALRACPAHEYFAAVDPAEARFVGGADDRLLGPAHNNDLRRICPGARHEEIAGLGHMVHLERPDVVKAPFMAD
jgi:pimeloyl-ACP methyl ester carboxylesterase